MLVDPGIGLLDVQHPDARLGRALIEGVGLKLLEHETAGRRLELLGRDANSVTDIVLTHADPDHAGALADFPSARVHMSAEQHAALQQGRPRYLPSSFAHGPRWVLHGVSSQRWFGLEARPLPLGLSAEVLLIPLFGHTPGHCGVAIQQDGHWLLHAGDAYYLRPEVHTDDHPVSQLSARNAEDDTQRRASLSQLRRLARDHADEVRFFSYHDPDELPR